MSTDVFYPITTVWFVLFNYMTHPSSDKNTYNFLTLNAAVSYLCLSFFVSFIFSVSKLTNTRAVTDYHYVGTCRWISLAAASADPVVPAVYCFWLSGLLNS